MPKTYGTVTTFTAGSVLTAAQLNTASTAINNLVVPPSVGVYNTGNVSVANVTWTRLSFTTSAWDTDTIKGAGTVTGLTVGVTGLYLVSAYVIFDASATGTQRQVLIDKGTSASLTSTIVANSGKQGSSNFADISASAVASLTAGDTVQVFVFHDAGASLNILGAANRLFSLTWIGRTS